MLAAFFVLAALPAWTPARWNSGDPKSLDLLTGTPINCLLLESANWNAEFVHQAGVRGIAILGVLHTGPDLSAAARRAAELTLAGVVLEGDYAPGVSAEVRSALAGSGLAIIELPLRRRIRIDGTDAILGTAQGLWPGIEAEHGGAIVTGPTSNPWIDTNTGFLRFLRAATGATLWLGVRPPPHRAYPVERYQVAIADAAMSGARWILALDDDLDRRLLAREPRAVDAWKQITAFLAYYTGQAAWRDYRPYSKFALVQDAASGGFLSASLLDMLAVQHTAVRPILTRKLSAAALHDARVVLNVDAGSLSALQKEELDSFMASGGTLVNPPDGWRFPETSEQQMTPDRRQMNRIQGIWESVYNATARKNFGARTFNTSTVLYNLLAAPDAKSLLIQLVNYADFAADTITVQVQGQWKHARLYRPGLPPRELPVYPVRDGTGIDIDKIAIAGTLQVDQ